MKTDTIRYSIETPFGTITRESARDYDFVIFRVLRNPTTGAIFQDCPGNTGKYRFTNVEAQKNLKTLRAAPLREWNPTLREYVTFQLVGVFAFVTPQGAGKGLADAAQVLLPEYMPAPAPAAEEVPARYLASVYKTTPGRPKESYSTYPLTLTEAAALADKLKAKNPRHHVSLTSLSRPTITR